MNKNNLLEEEVPTERLILKRFGCRIFHRGRFFSFPLIYETFLTLCNQIAVKYSDNSSKVIKNTAMVVVTSKAVEELWEKSTSTFSNANSGSALKLTEEGNSTHDTTKKNNLK